MTRTEQVHKSADILDRVDQHLRDRGWDMDWEDNSVRLFGELVDVIKSLRTEVRTQRAEIGQLINVRNVLLEADKPPQYDNEVR